MLTDYKFWFIRRDDDGFITEVAVRFYEGEIQIVDGKEVYARIKRLSVANGELNHLADKLGKINTRNETNSNEAIYYFPKDFGQIKTDDELCKFLNQQLAKDKTREPIKEQT